MSILDNIPPEIVRAALDGAERLARWIAGKAGHADDVEAVDGIVNAQINAALAAGVELGLGLGAVAHGSASVVEAMREAEIAGRKRMDFPPDTVELKEVTEDKFDRSETDDSEGT